MNGCFIVVCYLGLLGCVPSIAGVVDALGEDFALAWEARLREAGQPQEIVGGHQADAA